MSEWYEKNYERSSCLLDVQVGRFDEFELLERAQVY